MISAQRLARLCPDANRDIIAAISPIMEDQFPQFGVTTILRRAHLLGQLAHESAHFTRLKENLNYSAPRICEVWKRLCPRAKELEHNPEKLGNAAYGGRLGNGPEASGDGYRFRGRGLIQITGRENYIRFSADAGVDLMSSPDVAADPRTAVLVALGFWKKHNLNEKADADDCAAITRVINGGVNGLAERRALVTKAKAIFV